MHTNPSGDRKYADDPALGAEERGIAEAIAYNLRAYVPGSARFQRAL